MAALAQSHNVLSFQPKQEYRPREQYQTSSERDVYNTLYLQTRNGTESRRFTLDGLKFATGIKSQNTVRVALAGLVRKGHVTVLDKKDVAITAFSTACRCRMKFGRSIKTRNIWPNKNAWQQRSKAESQKPNNKNSSLTNQLTSQARAQILRLPRLQCR